MFCGNKVISVEDEGYDVNYSPCIHTLFVATDDGFVYRSELFDQNMNIVGIEESNILDSDYSESIDFYTDKCSLLTHVSLIVSPKFMAAVHLSC